MNPKDKRLALTLASEYNLPPDELCISIDWIRGCIEGGGTEAGRLIDLVLKKHYQNKLKILTGSSVKIKITTKAGEVLIDELDSFYPYFKTAINKTIKACDRLSKTSQEPKNKKSEKDIPLEALMEHLPSARPYTKCVIMGLLLVYFKLDPTIKTEQEFKENPTDSAQDYKHYLADIVKNRLKKVTK